MRGTLRSSIRQRNEYGVPGILDQKGPDRLQGGPKTLSPVIVLAGHRQDILRAKVRAQPAESGEEFVLENGLEVCHLTHRWPPFSIELFLLAYEPTQRGRPFCQPLVSKWLTLIFMPFVPDTFNSPE